MRGFLGRALVVSGTPLFYDQIDTSTQPTPTTSSMEPNAENYNPGHYAVHNREDLGRAFPGDTLELTAKKFRELDIYDKEKWLQFRQSASRNLRTSRKQQVGRKRLRRKPLSSRASIATTSTPLFAYSHVRTTS